MQVMDDDGMPFEKHPARGLGRFVGQLVRVAIDVDERILRPVRRRLARQRGAIGLAFQITVEPLDLLVAAIRIGDRSTDSVEPVSSECKPALK